MAYEMTLITRSSDIFNKSYENDYRKIYSGKKYYYLHC